MEKYNIMKKIFFIISTLLGTFLSLQAQKTCYSTEVILNSSGQRVFTLTEIPTAPGQSIVVSGYAGNNLWEPFTGKFANDTSFKEQKEIINLGNGPREYYTITRFILHGTVVKQQEQSCWVN